MDVQDPKRLRRAVLLTAAVLVAAVAVCGVGLLIASRIPGIAGCEEGPPYVSGVQEDVERVARLVPALSGTASAAPGPADPGITSTRYRWREARPRTCPDLGPMDFYYEGFAVLTPDRAQALRTGYRWTDTDAPAVPEELVEYGPPQAAWQRSADLDSGSRGQIWFDQGSGTVYFSYLTD